MVVVKTWENGLITVKGGIFPPLEFIPLIAEGDEYLKIKLGREIHDRPSFFVWVGRDLCPTLLSIEKVLFLPPVFKGARIEETSKGALVLKPGPFYLFSFIIEEGYRGESSISLLSPCIWSRKFYSFASPRGRLGVAEGMLIITEKPEIIIHYQRSGRLYGGLPEGWLKIKYLNEEEAEIIEIPPPEITELI